MVPHPPSGPARPRRRPAVEELEDRRLLSTLFAISTANTLLRFDSAAPGTILSTKPIRGVQGGESIVALDFRPATGQLYGVGSASRLYTLDTATGDATPVGQFPFGPVLSVPEVGADFDPVTDQLRVVSNALFNLRLNPDTGADVGTDSPLTYATGSPAVAGLGYTNNFTGAADTTLFGIDYQQNALVRQGSPGGSPLSPNGGQLFTIGALGISANGVVGLDVSPADGTAFAVLAPTGVSRLYRINLTTGAATLVGTVGDGTVAIADVAVAMPGRLQFTAATATVAETGGSVTFTVARVGGSDGTVSVQFASGGGTATAGSDYTAVSGTLTFGPGILTQTFSLPIRDDTLVEGPETVNLTLSNPSGTVLGSPTTEVLTITDVEEGQFQFGAAAFSVAETGGGVTFTVARVGGSDGTATVHYAASGGTATAGVDYTAVAGTLTFGPGVTSQSFTVPILDDALVEGSETVNLTLSSPGGGARLGTPAAAVLTITDFEEGRLQFSAATYAGSETGGAALITVNRVGGSDGTVSVQFAAGNGSAAAGADYIPVAGTLTFGPGETSHTFAVPILRDGFAEGAETVNLTLSAPSGGATLGTPAAAVLTIADEAAPPQRDVSAVVSVTPASGRLVRGGRRFRVRVVLQNLGAALHGPLALTLGSLPPGVRLLNAAALAALAPGADNVFGSGEALVVNVDFNRPFGFRRQVTFRVLAGVFVPPGSATVGKT